MTRDRASAAIGVALFAVLVVVTLVRPQGGDTTATAPTHPPATAPAQGLTPPAAPGSGAPVAGPSVGIDGLDPLALPVPPDAVLATVTRVSDGDTVRLELDVEGRPSVRARLLRIDAPEVARDGAPGDCGADLATERLAVLTPPGSVVAIAWDQARQDRFGRELVHVWDDDGTWVNGLLLAQGWARVATFAPNVAHDARVLALEAQARAAGRGIWGLC